MDKHETLDQASPTGGTFFAALKSFDANIPISGNFILNCEKLEKLCRTFNPRLEPHQCLHVYKYLDQKGGCHTKGNQRNSLHTHNKALK